VLRLSDDYPEDRPGMDIFGVHVEFDEDGNPHTLRKRGRIVKVDEYYGDEPGERDADGRFARRGGGGDYERKKRLLLRRRRRLQAAPTFRGSTPEMDASRKAVWARANETAATIAYKPQLQTHRAPTTSQSQKVDNAALQAILQKKLLANIAFLAQKRDQRTERQRTTPARPQEGQSRNALGASLRTDLTALGPVLRVVNLDDIAGGHGNISDMLATHSASLLEDMNTGRMSQAERQKHALKRDLQNNVIPRSGGNAGLGMEMTDQGARSLAHALASIIGTFHRTNIPMEVAEGVTFEEVRAAADGYVVGHRPSGTTGEDSFYRARSVNDPPVAMIFGSVRGGEGPIDHLANGETVYADEHTDTHEIANLIQEQMEEAGVRGKNIDVFLNRILSLPAYPVDIIATK
jgi:hypothetical protein